MKAVFCQQVMKNYSTFSPATIFLLCAWDKHTLAVMSERNFPLHAVLEENI